MKTRLSLPLLRSIALLGYVALATVVAIALVRDFHLTSFVSGVFFAIAASDALHFFHPTQDLTS